MLVSTIAFLVLGLSFDEIEEHIDHPTATIDVANMQAAIAVNGDQGNEAIDSSTGQVGKIPSYAWGTTAGGQTIYAPARLRA